MGIVLSSTNWLAELSLTIALIGNMQFDVLLFRLFNIIPCIINFIANCYQGGLYFDNFILSLVIILVNGGYIIYYIVLKIKYLKDKLEQEIYDKYFKDTGISILKFEEFMRLGQRCIKKKNQKLEDIACSSEIFDIVYLFINDEKSNHYLTYSDKKTGYQDTNRQRIAWIGFAELFSSVLQSNQSDDSSKTSYYFGDYSYECETHLYECNVVYYKFDVTKLLNFIQKDKEFKSSFLSVFENEISFMLHRMRQSYLKEKISRKHQSIGEKIKKKTAIKEKNVDKNKPSNSGEKKEKNKNDNKEDHNPENNVNLKTPKEIKIAKSYVINA